MLTTIGAQVLYLLLSGILHAAGEDRLISATKGMNMSNSNEGQMSVKKN